LGSEPKVQLTNKIRNNKEEVKKALLKRLKEGDFNLDEIIALDDKRKKLVNKYNINYIFEDFYSAEAEQKCLKIWEELGNKAELTDMSYYCLRITNKTLAESLKTYGIEIKEVKARLDIASTKAPLFDLYAIKPIKTGFNVELVYQEKIGEGSAARILKIS